MAITGLVRGMGSFFKECEHPESRWSKCSHEYKIRYRNAAGQQAEESGFATQQKAMTRLAEVYHARKDSPQSRRKAERVKKYGGMQFSAYAAEWLKSQRHQGPTSLRNVESTLRNHLLSAFGSRRTGTFDQKVVEAFIGTMERNGVGRYERAARSRSSSSPVTGGIRHLHRRDDTAPVSATEVTALGLTSGNAPVTIGKTTASHGTTFRGRLPADCMSDRPGSTGVGGQLPFVCPRSGRSCQSAGRPHSRVRASLQSDR